MYWDWGGEHGGVRMTNSARRSGAVLSLAIGLYAAVTLSTTALLARAPELDSWTYLPFAAKPVPTPTWTPTPTPTPTVTPTPRLMDVRVEGSCCDFTGGSQQDPNGEYACFKNYEPRSVAMTDWRVEDAKQHTYCFPQFALSPGAIVKLHSGPGADTVTDLHWGRGLVWNNDHDTVYLYDHLGRLVSRYVY